jgi:hypothetical protein
MSLQSALTGEEVFLGKVYSEMDESLRDFIACQHIFFVATAPLSAAGHVNVSPKGMDTLRVLGSRRVAYLDLTGSGVETVAHLRDNGRITVMFCAFEGRPRIVRLYGKGHAVEPGDADWTELVGQFPEREGTRAVIDVAVERVADSCGYSVPLFEYTGERTQLEAWAERKGPDGLRCYRTEKNARSIDGLPGLRSVENGSDDFD